MAEQNPVIKDIIRELIAALKIVVEVVEDLKPKTLEASSVRMHVNAAEKLLEKLNV